MSGVCCTNAEIMAWVVQLAVEPRQVPLWRDVASNPLVSGVQAACACAKEEVRPIVGHYNISRIKTLRQKTDSGDLVRQLPLDNPPVPAW